MPKKNEFLADADIIIIGGGPSGTSTALHLDQINPRLAERTLVLEKSQHPRDKICGGALTLNAERILAELGVPLDISSAPIHHVRLVYGDACIDLPEDGCSKRVIRRCDFDGMLFKAVKQRGIRTMENIRVTKLLRRPDHLLVVTDRGMLRAQIVVSADGVNAIVRKMPGFGPGRMRRVYEIETPADPSQEYVFQEQLLLVDMSYTREGLKGYYWDFPCYIDGKPYVSRGIVTGSPVGNNAFLDDILARRGVDLTGALRKAWPIRHFDARENFAQPRMLLVGDALGCDPLFSEGISQGLESGRLAAEAIEDAMRRNDLSFSRYTRKVLNSRLGKELLAYSRAARILYGRNAELVLSLLHESSELRDLIGHSYAGTASIAESMGRIVKLTAGHLLRYRGRIREFRAAAGFDQDSAQPAERALAETPS